MRPLLCLLIVLPCFGYSYNILGIFPFPGGSHYVMFETLMKGLAEKGHTVDVVSHFPQKSPQPRFNDLSLRGSMDLFVNHAPVSFVVNELHNRFGAIKFMLQSVGPNMCKHTLNTTVLNELKHSTKKYDLIITEMFANDCMLGFAHILNTPVIAIASSVSLPWSSDRLGNPDNPSYIPTYFGKYGTRMTLLERLDNTVWLVISKIWFRIISYRSSGMVQTFYGNDVPSMNQLASKTSIIFVNSHFSMNGVRPTVPGFIEVGGLHIKPPKVVPKQFEDVMNISRTPQYKGVVLFTMGSMVLTETLPLKQLTDLFNAFKEIPYKILWKADKEKLPTGLDIPPNIHFEPWLPQLDILCHPNMKLFISHGGLMGLQEAVYCGIPIIGVPLYGDQLLNLNVLKELGLAILINYNDISKTSVLSATKEILNDAKYKENAEIVSKQFKDRPLSPLDTAIYWIEYVIRHKGAPHLRSFGADLPWYQYHLLDVIVISILSLAFFLYITYIALVVVLRLTVQRIKVKRE